MSDLEPNQRATNTRIYVQSREKTRVDYVMDGENFFFYESVKYDEQDQLTVKFCHNILFP